MRPSEPENARVPHHGGVRRVPARSFAAVVLGAAIISTGVAVAAPASAASPGSLLSRIKACESGGSYTVVNPSSSASGAYQFLNSTWQGLPAAAGYASAASAPPAVQDLAARQLFAQAGSSPWAASAACWSRGGAPTGSIPGPRSLAADQEVNTSAPVRRPPQTQLSTSGSAESSGQTSGVEATGDQSQQTGGQSQSNSHVDQQQSGEH